MAMNFKVFNDRTCMSTQDIIRKQFNNNLQLLGIHLTRIFTVLDELKERCRS